MALTGQPIESAFARHPSLFSYPDGQTRWDAEWLAREEHDELRRLMEREEARRMWRETKVAAV